jgi:hypothetical protein
MQDAFIVDGYAWDDELKDIVNKKSPFTEFFYVPQKNAWFHFNIEHHIKTITVNMGEHCLPFVLDNEVHFEYMKTKYSTLMIAEHVDLYHVVAFRCIDVYFVFSRDRIYKFRLPANNPWCNLQIDKATGNPVMIFWNGDINKLVRVTIDMKEQLKHHADDEIDLIWISEVHMKQP